MYKTLTARFQLLACLSALSVSACAGEPVELFPSHEIKLAETDAGAPADAAPVGPPTFCSRRPGTDPTSTRCALTTHTCTSAGEVRTEIEYNGCDVVDRFTGDPTHSIATCDEAYGAESGETSLVELHCHRSAADDACCLERAEGQADAPLLTARVCVPNCANTPSVPGAALTSCDAVYAEADLTLGASFVGYGVDLIGRACEGSFMCGTGLTTHPDSSEPQNNFVSSYGHKVFCAHGKLQLITEGPMGIYVFYD